MFSFYHSLFATRCEISCETTDIAVASNAKRIHFCHTVAKVNVTSWFTDWNDAFPSNLAAAWSWERWKRESHRRDAQNENGRNMRDASGKRDEGGTRPRRMTTVRSREENEGEREQPRKKGCDGGSHAWGNAAWERLCQFASCLEIDY